MIDPEPASPKPVQPLVWWKGLLLFAAACLFFLIANRKSYQGYFQADDFDTLSWTPFLSWQTYVSHFFTWRVAANNFRPVGHSYYHLMNQMVGLHFTPWLVILQIVHLSSVLVFWRLLRRLDFSLLAVVTGCFFFLLHPAVFDAYWKPMYIVDVTCGFFCLLCILLYISDHWIFSLLAFFVAFRCKEIVILLPLALAAYEFYLGSRRWKRLVPFFLLSLCFGIQGILNNQNNGPYSLRLSHATLWDTSSFYARYVFLFTGSAFSTVAMAIWTRDRRAYWGLATFALLLVPMLLLPGRLFSVYLYVPLLGVAILIAAAVERKGWMLAAAFAIIWLPLTLYRLHAYSRYEVAVANDSRAYLTDLQSWLQTHPAAHTYRYQEVPDGVDPWMVPAAIMYLTHEKGLDIAEFSDEDLIAAPGKLPTILVWNQEQHHLLPLLPSDPTLQQSYIRTAVPSGLLQLREGWYGQIKEYRWTKPTANAVLRHPLNATTFKASFILPEIAFQQGNHPTLQLLLNGKEYPAYGIRPGKQEAEWQVSASIPDEVQVRFVVSPPVHVSGDQRDLGIAMVSFGFAQP